MGASETAWSATSSAVAKSPQNKSVRNKVSRPPHDPRYDAALLVSSRLRQEDKPLPLTVAGSKRPLLSETRNAFVRPCEMRREPQVFAGPAQECRAPCRSGVFGPQDRPSHLW